MKNRYFILSVLFWAIASVCMAITLPSSSYNSYESYDMGNEGYTLGIGTTFKNTSILSSYNPGTCQGDKQDPNVLQDCQDCCWRLIDDELIGRRISSSFLSSVKEG